MMTLHAVAATRPKKVAALVAFALAVTLAPAASPAAALQAASARAPRLTAASGATASAAPASAPPPTVTLAPVADAYVSATSPSLNFGSSQFLRVDGAPVVRSYLRFDLRGVAGRVAQATLMLRAGSSSTQGYTVATTSGGWAESTVTYSTAPAAGATIALAGPCSSGTTKDTDVSSAAAGGGVLNLVIAGRGATALRFGSRESATPPALRLTLEPLPTPAAPSATPPTASPGVSATPTPSASAPASASRSPSSAPSAASSRTPSPTASGASPSPTPRPSMPAPTPGVTPTAPPTMVSGLRWGLIGNDGTHLAAERAAGITTKLLELSWRSYEPSAGSFSAGYVDSKKRELSALRAAGFQVILSLGVQYAPAWLLSYPNAYYVNQDGIAYNDTCSGCEIPNFVFNPFLRSLMDRYVGRVFADLGVADFAAVRLGGGHYGELGYPTNRYGANSNTYWAYDANAQASSPVPGWKPGMPSPNGEATKFLNWYLQKLADYETWQKATARKYYAGPLIMLFPSWGIRPGQADAAAAGNLGGATSAEINGEIQRGYDFARQVAAIKDAKVFVATTWLDAPYGSDSSADARDWRPVHYLSYLAGQHPLRLRMYGENTGGGDRAAMSFTRSQAAAYGLIGFLWFNESELFSGQYATLADYAACIAAN